MLISPLPSGEGSRPSVSALVGSVDKFACRYATQIGIQKTDGKKVHSPVIESLQAMVKNMLIKFYQSVRVKPQRIIFYRDGISEGQFYQVMMYEVGYRAILLEFLAFLTVV